MIIKLLISLIPIILFLVMLLYLDSIKLVDKRLLLYCLGWGVVSAGLSYLLNSFLISRFQLSFDTCSGFIAPEVEEILKFSFLWILIKKGKAGFMIDAAIYGFAIGAGFSLVENLFYLFRYAAEVANPMVWITRGFGAAVMHGGATAIFGILCMGAISRRSNLAVSTIYGALAAIFIHGIYNQFLVSPLLSTVIIVLLIPGIIMLIFSQNEKSIRNWLELEFDSELDILRMIRQGRFSETRTGSFLVSLQARFPGEVVVDMYCYISLYLELSIKAKSLIMLKEHDLVIPGDPSLPGKLQELKALRKIIGRGGLMAIAPVLRMNRKDLWKLSLLG
jgi:RsiW-degrading membrane proteinase PrsW (M82 family)